MYETRHPQLGLSAFDVDLVICFLLAQRAATLGEIEVLADQERRWPDFGESHCLPVLRQREALLKDLAQRLGPLRQALYDESGGRGAAGPQIGQQLSLFEQQR